MAELANHLKKDGLTVDGRSPLAEPLGLALPTVAQMASYTLIQFVDTWFLAHTSSECSCSSASNEAAGIPSTWRMGAVPIPYAVSS